MSKFFYGFFGFLLLVGLSMFIYSYKTGYKFEMPTDIFTKATINLTSSEFVQGGEIPSLYTCDGEDISPDLNISNVPVNAISLAVTLEDDSTFPVFYHWILYNIDPELTSIDSMKTFISTPLATNDFGKAEYDGPCPSNGTHKYVFKVYALDTEIDKNLKDKTDFLSQISGNIIASGTLSGVYSKSR